MKQYDVFSKDREKETKKQEVEWKEGNNETDKKKIISKWENANGTRIFWDDIWVYLLNLLKLYISLKTR